MTDTLPKRMTLREDASRRTADRHPSSPSLVMVVLAVGMAAAALVWQWNVVELYPRQALAVLLVSALAATIRVETMMARWSVTVGLTPMALALLLAGPETAIATYGAWIAGSILGVWWVFGDLRRAGSTVLTTAIAGIAMIATRMSIPPIGDPVSVVNEGSESVAILASMAAYFAVTVGVGLVVGCVQMRTPPPKLIRNVGWLRVLTIFLGQSAGAILGHGFVMYVVRVVEADQQFSLFEGSVSVVLAVIAPAGILLLTQRVRGLAKREASISTALTSVPWAVTKSVREHVTDHLEAGLPGFQVSTITLDGTTELPPNGGRSIVSDPLEENGTEFVAVVNRTAMVRPFNESDQQFVRAICSLGRESLRADEEVARLRSISNTDPMTGLWNYRALRSHMLDLDTTKRHAGLAALIFLNVQNLTQINREYSPDTGDEVLRAVAKRIRVATADQPLVSPARVAGDEFGVLALGLTSERQAEQLAWSLDSVVSAPVHTDMGLVSVVVTQTISFADSDSSEGFAGLIHRADQQMYRARRKFVNMAVSGELALDLDEEDEAESGERALSGPSAALADAIKHDRLRQVYEPIVDCEQMRIVALEASVRYTDPILGRLPVPFIRSESDRLGLRTEMVVQVLQHSVTDMERFRAQAPELNRLHVNISLAQLVDLRFTSELEKIRKNHPELDLVLELEGSSIRLAPQETTDKAAEYAECHDLKLALDHVGTVYSEVGALGALPIYAVKISDGILHTMGGDRARTAVEGYLAAVEAYGAQVIFEGVGTAGEAQLIQEMGVRLAQGPFYGRPVSSSEFLMRLETMGLTLS